MSTAVADYDVLIVGGGMVGASLACALADQPLRVAVVESASPGARSQPGYDDRSLALALGSRRIFETLGLWQQLAAEAEPIHQIHVSDRGRFGGVRLDCAAEHVEALGYVIRARALGGALQERMAALSNVDVFAPAELEYLATDMDMAHARIDHPQGPRTLRAALVVGADGDQSAVRSRLAIPVSRWDYGQTAVIANVTVERSHHHVAFERFTDSGPLALLPLHAPPGSTRSDTHCALVWTVRHAQAESVLEMPDHDFLRQVQDRFGYRLGRLLKAGARQGYPLALVRACEHVRQRAALIGNAAHTLHPVAGQGFNLGIRDVAALAELLVAAAAQGGDPGAMSVLRRYAAWRQRDHRAVIAFTDGLARVFSNPLPPVGWLRDLGLLGVDLLPPVKHALARRTMGLAGRLPRLARGLPL